MGLRATLSFAGRVERIKPYPVPTRIGGFGGAQGLAYYLAQNGFTHLIDATHPFAAQMSDNAIRASAMTGFPFCAFTRPPWQAQEGDNWITVRSIQAAVGALSGRRRRVFLAIGRQNLAAFAKQEQHRYVLRLVDSPQEPPPLPDHLCLISRGPFTEEGDIKLLRSNRIDVVVSKNSGGAGAYSKIAAARQLQVPVIMIERPKIPPRHELHDLDAVMEWITQTGA